MRSGLCDAAGKDPLEAPAIEAVLTALPLVGEGGMTPEPPVLNSVVKPPSMLKSLPSDG